MLSKRHTSVPFWCAAIALLAACTHLPTTPVTPTTTPFDTRPVPVQNTASTLPEGWQHKGLLEVYVRGYQDSNGDGIGDLRGLTSRLDHIKNLGVGGIWLMPIMASQDRDHGYATRDYRDIEPDYGTLADFDELLKQAHARGLGVVIDYVVNHAAAEHPAFVESAKSANGPHRDWFIWQPQHPVGWDIYGSDPWRGAQNAKPGAGGQADPAVAAFLTGARQGEHYFAGFSRTMPDFNLKSPAVIAWHHDNMRFWLNRGVDGFRLDAVGHLIENGPSAWDNQPENLAVLRGLQSVLAPYQHRYLVCEGPGAPVLYAGEVACGSAFAFQHNGNLMKAAQGNAAALAAVRGYPLAMPAATAQRMATMLSNHDAFAGTRVADQLNGNTAQMKLAAAMYLLMPGVPFVYYGEELGMRGATSLGGDWALRTPMPWVAAAPQHGFSSAKPFRAFASNAPQAAADAQQVQEGSMLRHYQALLALRSARPSIAQGSYRPLPTTQDAAVLAFERAWQGSGGKAPERTVVLINTAAQAADFQLQGLVPSSSWRTVLGAERGDPSADQKGQLLLNLPAHGVLVLAQK